MNNATQTVTPTNPDSETIERIESLGYVGTALFSAYSETSFETDYFVAKESLNKFKAGIDKLNLNPGPKKGIYDLIKFLDVQLDKHKNEQISNAG